MVMDNLVLTEIKKFAGYVVLYQPVLTAAQGLRCTLGSLALLLSYMVLCGGEQRGLGAEPATLKTRTLYSNTP